MSKKLKKTNTIGNRLQIAFKELEISREEGAETIGTSLATINRYLCDQETIPEFRMDLLLIKKGVSKEFVFKNKGIPKATWEERLNFVEKEKALINEIRHNAVLKELISKLSKLSDENLKFISVFLSKLKP
ncbi:hypothetical protein BES34_000155 [Leptospira inadai serovar Lyme]|nr:hypothetical protein [Leptospira inadai]PNV76743.1 hypothetical protein BES34_000155 [Leptospira inadai serovar Lyme]